MNQRFNDLPVSALSEIRRLTAQRSVKPQIRPRPLRCRRTWLLLLQNLEKRRPPDSRNNEPVRRLRASHKTTMRSPHREARRQQRLRT